MNETNKKLSAEIQQKLEEKFATPEFKSLIAEIKEAGNSSGTFKMIISTDAIDRAGEMIMLDAWDFGNYLKSPVVLWGHDYNLPPIGITDKLYVEGNKVIAEGRFAPTPFAQEIRALYDMGMQRASSVGFIAKEVEGNIITKAELLEWSFVSVPCNQEALSMLTAQGMSVKELTTKGIITAELKEGEVIDNTTEEKGEVQDTLDEEAKMELKWENMRNVWDILCALSDVYYDPTTPVEDFGKLLGEAITILQTVADGTYVAPEDTNEEKGIRGKIKKQEKTLIEKLVKAKGNVESEQETAIKSTIDSIKNLSFALEGLLKVPERKTEDDIEVKEDVKEGEDFLYLRSVLQTISTGVSEALAEARQRAKSKNIIK